MSSSCENDGLILYRMNELEKKLDQMIKNQEKFLDDYLKLKETVLKNNYFIGTLTSVGGGLVALIGQYIMKN